MSSEFDEGIEHLRVASGEGTQAAPRMMAALVFALGEAGHGEDARREFANLQSRFGRDELSPTDWAKAHLGIGDGDGALEWLREGVTQHDNSLYQLGQDPEWDALRGYPVFRRIVEEIGIPRARLSSGR